MRPRNRFSNSKSASNKATSKSASSATNKNNEEEKKLLKDIQQLKSIIEQAEWSMEMLRFKDVEPKIEPRELQTSHFDIIPNVKVRLQNDLYKFAGLHCIKFKKSEAIFNFTSANDHQKDTYGVQILVNDEKKILGKWVMPMSIDINEISTKIPIDKPRNLTAFIKNCKHNIDCYTVREQQFLLLQEHILRMKHCTLYHNMGYKQITLEMYGICDEDDKYVNLIIYLFYHSDEARPYQIKIDTTTKKKLSEEIRQRWKIHLKEFKISDLQTAFDQVFMKKNSAFKWTPGDESESPLEINNTSTSGEENCFEHSQSERKKSLRRTKRKRQLQEKWNKRMRQVRIMSNTDDDSDDEVHSKARVLRPKSLCQTPTKKRKVTFRKQQKQIDKNLLESTPINKPKVKLKQTKLNFQATELTNSDNINEESLIRLRSHDKPSSENKKLGQLITSTPLPPRVRSKAMVYTLEIDNITEIGSPPKKVVDHSNFKSSNPSKYAKTLKK